MASSKRRRLAAIISFFIVGGGQVFSGRFWSGLWLFVIFYGTIYVLKLVWTGANQGFWAIIAAWVLLWLYNIFDAYKGVNYEPAPCEKACPANLAPWVYLNQVGTRANWRYPFIPFFRTLGLICPAPCEDKCTRHVVDEPVAIRHLKHAVATDKPGLPPGEKRREKIAVIGAGPCGLSTAYALSVKGYMVTVFEKEKSAGGIPAFLIPEFRLPFAHYAEEVKELQNENITIQYNTQIGKDLRFDDLVRDFDAVFIATGAWKQSALDVPGEDRALDAFDILRRIKNKEKINLGKVAVIGGGNTALDVARSLKRLGHDVKIYYRRNITDMPCEPDNRQETLEEGIDIVPLTLPVAYSKNQLRMVKIICEEGRRGKIEIVKGSEHEIEVDNVVCAIGQKPDTGFFRDLVKTNSSGMVLVKSGRSSLPKVYAGGDVALDRRENPQTIAFAVGHGLETAETIHHDLRKTPGVIRWLQRDTSLPVRIKMLVLNNGSRLKIPMREPAKRLADFKQVEHAADKEAMFKEANRCLTCPLRYRP